MAVRAVLLLLFFARCLLSISKLELSQLPSVTTDTSVANTMFGPLCLAPRVYRTIKSGAPKSTPRVARSVLLLILLVCGDVQINPGPECVQDPCSVCDSPVSNEDDGLLCEVCLNWNHRTCANMSLSEYYHWSTIEDGWICQRCERDCFPFHSVSHLTSSLDSSSTTSSTAPIQHPSTHLKVFSFNARSILPNIDQLRSLCFLEHFDVVAVCDTWLSANILDSEISIDGYNLIRKDRNRHGGGVLLYINCAIPYTPLQLPFPELELVLAECHLNSHLFTIASFYRPPTSTIDTMSKLHDIVSLLRPQNLSNLVLCGDFNIDPTRQVSPHSRALRDLQLDYNLTQVVPEPTRLSASLSSTIDLVLLSNSSSLESCSVSSPVGSSNHASVSVILKLPQRRRLSRPPMKTVWLYNSTNMSLARELLSKLPVA